MATKTSKTKTVTIRDSSDRRLRLTPTRLVQIEFFSNRPWYTTRDDFRKAYRENTGIILIHEVGTSKSLGVTFFPQGREIGCCSFSPEVFKQIVQRFGARKSRAKAAKAGA